MALRHWVDSLGTEALGGFVCTEALGGFVCTEACVRSMHTTKTKAGSKTTPCVSTCRKLPVIELRPLDVLAATCFIKSTATCVNETPVSIESIATCVNEKPVSLKSIATCVNESPCH